MNPSNYRWGLPVQASTYAGTIDHLLWVLHIVMISIFVLWGIYMVYCLIRYRGTRSPQAVYSHKSSLAAYTPDVIILLFEVWLIFVIGVPIWAHIKEELPKPENATEVNVVAQQFAWIVHYPGPDGKFGKTDPALVNFANPLGLDPQDPNSKDDFFSINEFYMPLGKPALIHLSSHDVIHSFFVPEFRIKQDVVPGMNIPIWVEPTLPGHFELSCAQLCGAAHYRMRADVFVLTPKDFEDWMQKQIHSKGI